MLCFFVLSAISYTPSIFGYTGTDTVQAQETDSIIILNEVPKSKDPKPISAKGYSDPPIEENQYVWPDHGKTCTDQQLNNETSGIQRDFCKWAERVDEEELYYHPAGSKQFFGDDAVINTSTRYKARVFLNSRRDSYHPTGLYAPPGELITMEIPPKAVGKITFIINRHVDPAASHAVRLGGTRCEFSLRGTVTQFMWPYGGTIEFAVSLDTFNAGVDVNVTGAIRSPYFIYGVTTDEEWEEEVSKYPGPILSLDYGAGFVAVPSKFVRSYVKLNDAMAFWRSVSRVLYSCSEVSAVPRRSDGRVRTPLRTTVDRFVRVGTAVALTGGNQVYEPIGWQREWKNYDYAKWGCWGQLHEYAHHFQNGWEFGAWGEVSNNVLNLISMSLMTEIDATRMINFWGSIAMSGDWANTAHQAGNVNAKDLLYWYGLHLYWFGPDRQRKIIRSTRDGKYFARNGSFVSQFMLTISYIAKRDMRPYFKTWPNLDNYTASVTATADSLLDSWGFKEFHPVSIIYQTGYVYDGEEFETAKPFRIPAREPYLFDFEQFKKTRDEMHTFTFKRVIPGQGTFEEIGTAQYTIIRCEVLIFWINNNFSYRH